MIKRQSIKKGHHKAGKSFVLLFNRVSMYGPGHPFSVQAVEEFHRSVCELLKATSPVVLMHSQGQLLLEDEPLDPSLNYFKLLSHLKKANVSSIAVLRDVEKREIEEFVRIFLDTRRYPTEDLMKAAAAAMKISHLRINHVSYQKVTEDDEIVSKSSVATSAALGAEMEVSRQSQEALGMITGKLLLEEVDQRLSLKMLMSDPAAYSKHMVAIGVAERCGEPPAVCEPAPAIAAQLASLRRDIGAVLSSDRALNLNELAAALIKMKNELQDAILAQKALGVLLDPEEAVKTQTEELSDSVVLRLIKDEYRKGQTPIERLAFVIQRIVTPTEELRRLLPKIRESLIGEGMPLSDFSELIKHLSQVIQASELVEWVHQGAETIGVEGADLLSRWKVDPAGMARFIYLATEIDRQSGSSKSLCDILVDYIERYTPKLLKPTSIPEEDSEGRLRQLAFSFNSRVLEGLLGEGADTGLLTQVEARLQQRLDASVEAIRAELAAAKASLDTRNPHQGTLLQRLLAGLSEGQELKQILMVMQAHSGEQRLDENDFSQIFERIQQVMQDRRRTGMPLPDIVFDKEITCALLEKEIARSARYGTDLTVITLSMLYVAPPSAGPEPSSQLVEVTTTCLTEIRQQLRNADWIGTLDKTLFIAVLPMTTAREAHITARRLLKRINSNHRGASDVLPPTKIAGAVVRYDPKTIANADAFVRFARTEHAEMTHRLRNLQEFM